MPLSFIIRNVNLSEMNVDAFVNIKSINSQNLPIPVFEHSSEVFFHNICFKFNYQKQIERGEIKVDLKKLGNALRHDSIMFGLSTKSIIDVNVPIYIDGTHGEKELLSKCYTNTLDYAKSNNFQNIL